MPRHYDMSSLKALASFEAAARHGGFKVAAREMNVTPAAISHQVKALEMDLGCALFLRANRGVELTEKGAFLFLALQRGFTEIAQAISYLKERPEAVDISIRTTPAISALWLTPKLNLYRQRHPDIAVSQQVSDALVAGGQYDLVFRYDFKRESSAAWHCIFEDRIIAISTQSFKERHRIVTSHDLLRVPLIHLSREEEDWMQWREWFASLGHDDPKGRGAWINNYLIALQTAEMESGALLGWEELVQPLVASGRLVQLTPDAVPSPKPLYLNIHPRASKQARAFCDWLLAQTL